MGTALKGIGILILFIAILGLLVGCFIAGISWLHSKFKNNSEKQIELRKNSDREKQNLEAGAPNPPILYCERCGNKLKTDVITHTTYDKNTGKPIYSFTAEIICPKCLDPLWSLEYYDGTWNEHTSQGSDAPDINIHIT